MVVDGVSLNPREVEIASGWYRHVLLADLDSVVLSDLFRGQRYDVIVCADVLEHLKDPQRLLSQCENLLEFNGQLITSVPNVGYCGLVADLIEGDFRYRSEGLLDSSHLRFLYPQFALSIFRDVRLAPSRRGQHPAGTF